MIAMFDTLSWMVSENLDATTNSGGIVLLLVLVTIMLTCTAVFGALRRARRRQAERVWAERDRVMFRFRHT